MRRLFLTALTLGFTLLAGCSPLIQRNITEEISPVVLWYMKEGTDGQLQISTIVPPLVKEEKRILTVQVDLVKQANKGFNLKDYRELKNGQLRVLLIDENLAKKGIMDKVSTFVIDPEISFRIYVAVVKGDFNQYIIRQLEKHNDFDYFLYRMLRHYDHQGDITVTNLQQFLKDYYSPYSDPAVSVLKVRGDNLEYDGTGYFRGDQLIGTVPLMQDQFYQLLSKDRFVRFLVMPSLGTTITIVRSNVKIRFSENYNSVFFKIHVVGRLEEYREEKDLFLEKKKSKLIKELETHIAQETAALLKKLQKSKSDPLKIGVHTLTPVSRPLTDQEWINRWEKMKINVDVQVSLDVIK